MNTKNLLIFLFASWLLISCKPSGNLSGHRKGNKPGLTTQQQLENGALFIDACREKILGNFNEAEKMFLKVLAADPKNDAAIYELGGIYELQNNNGQALKSAKEAYRLDPGNKWYKIFLADMYMKNQYYAESANLYKELALEGNDEDYYFNWTVALIYGAKYNEAIQVYNEMEKKFGVSEEVSLRKEKLYLQLNKVDKAAEEIEKLIVKFPGETKYYLLIAEIYVNNNLFDKAVPYYEKMAQLNPDDPGIHLYLSDYYRKKGEKEKSFEELKSAFRNPALDIDKKIKILLSYYTISEYYEEMKPQAYELMQLLTTAHPEDPKGFSMLGDFLYRDRKLKEAKEAFNKVISLDSSRYIIWETLLFIHSEENDNIALRNDSKHAMDLFPVQPIPYLFNGMANYMLKDYSGSLRSLKSGLELALENKKLEVQFNMYLGDTYYKLGKSDSSFYFYDQVLLADPRNTYVLNNYSYYLALQPAKLDKALEMAKKANELEPGNNSYQDTYGWVFYKSGNYKEAELWIGKALKNGAINNGEVLEHYGDVLFKLGRKDEALQYWQQAKEAGGASPDIDIKIRDKTLND